MLGFFLKDQIDFCKMWNVEYKNELTIILMLIYVYDIVNESCLFNVPVTNTATECLAHALHCLKGPPHPWEKFSTDWLNS